MFLIKEIYMKNFNSKNKNLRFYNVSIQIKFREYKILKEKDIQEK